MSSTQHVMCVFKYICREIVRISAINHRKIPDDDAPATTAPHIMNCATLKQVYSSGIAVRSAAEEPQFKRQGIVVSSTPDIRFGLRRC